MSKRKQPETTRMQQDATPCNNILEPTRPIDRFLRRRNELTQRQQAAVEMLLQGLSDQEAAAQLGVDRSTIFRWRQNLAFARELDRQRRLRSERAANQLQSMVPSALKILQQQLDSTDGRERMRAVSILLRFATPSRLGGAAAHDVVRAAASGPDAAATTPEPPGPAVKAAKAQSRREIDDIIAFVEAPLPGEPGAPEDMTEDLEDEEFGDDDDFGEGDDA